MRTHILSPVYFTLLASSAVGQSLEWSTDFAARGTQSFANDSLVFDDGSGPALYLAGRLVAAGPHADVDLGVWDGAEWRKLPAALQPYAGGVESASIQRLAAFDGGAGPELYAGGYFHGIAGVDARSIAKRGALGWEPLGGNLPAGNGDLFVTALSVVSYGLSPALYVGHSFESVAGLPASSLSIWDGTQWSSVGAPLHGRVLDVAAFDDGSGVKLYVAGQGLWSSSPLPVSAVIAWDGSTWSQVGGATNGVVERLVVHDDGAGTALFAAGNSQGAVVGVARLAGASWTPLNGTPLLGSVLDLEVLPTSTGARLVAGGTFVQLGGATSRGLALWDGVAWTNIGSEGLAGAPNGLGIANRVTSGDLGAGPRLFASGTFTRADSVPALNVVGWDGSSFAALGGGAGLSFGAAALSSFDGAVYVGGSFLGAGGSTAPYLARWSGVEWVEDAPLLDGRVESLAAFDDGQGEQLFVAGAFTQPAPAFLAWDGALSSSPGVLSSNGRILAQIAHVDGSGPALYVGGKFTSIGGVTAHNVARWDGVNWTRLGTDEPNNTVYALAFHDDGRGGGEQLYAGGAFISAGGQYTFGIARFDGASWSPVAAGFDAAVFALEVFDNGAGPQLYAGGAFASAPPYAVQRIARWDGVRWWPVGDGLAGQVLTLATFDDGGGPALIAGGDFLFSGLTQARRIARWSGSSWSELGGGTNDTVRVVRTLDDGTGLGQALWVGGSFHTVGGVVSAGIARWGRVCTPTPYCSSGVTSSGCVPTIDGVGRASAAQASTLLLTASALEGARSGHIFYGVDGPNAAPWGQSSHVLCVRAPTQRTGTQQTGGTAGACDGTLILDWGAYVATHPAALGQPFSAGQDVWAQGYFRDPLGPKTTALTNGVRFTICP